MRWSTVGLCVGLSGCGPDAADVKDASTSGSADAAGTTTDTGSTGGSSPTTGEPTSASTTTTGADASTGEIEECVEGTWEGTVSAGFEFVAFDDCDAVETWWFEGGWDACSAPLWVRVEGRLCGPGRYGHLGQWQYELRGEIVEGPCEGTCGAPTRCADFEALCPSFDCDPLVQDCPVAERCVPYATEGGPPWEGTRCVPLVDPAQAIGAACTSTAPWQDDCVAEAFCQADETGTGTCMPLCNAFVGERCDVGVCTLCGTIGKGLFVGVCGEDGIVC